MDNQEECVNIEVFGVNKPNVSGPVSEHGPGPGVPVAPLYPKPMAHAPGVIVRPRMAGRASAPIKVRPFSNSTCLASVPSRSSTSIVQWPWTLIPVFRPLEGDCMAFCGETGTGFAIVAEGVPEEFTADCACVIPTPKIIRVSTDRQLWQRCARIYLRSIFLAVAPLAA